MPETDSKLVVRKEAVGRYKGVELKGVSQKYLDKIKNLVDAVGNIKKIGVYKRSENLEWIDKLIGIGQMIYLINTLGLTSCGPQLLLVIWS